jgi:hypothetical protein
MRASWLTAPLIALAASANVAQAGAPGYPIRPESRVWFTGASNIRHFTCRARAVSGALDLRGTVTTSPVLTGENAATEPTLTVTVDQLDCGIGMMNNHLHEALRGAQHPRIEFRLALYEVDLNTEQPTARLTGVVTIAGVQRLVATTAAVHADSLGTLHVRGAYVIHPTEFGVAPPRRFLGLLRVHDRVTVHFDVALDSGAGVVKTINCLIMQCCDVGCTCCDTDLKRESTHDSHH